VAAWNNDEGRILTWSADGTARQWDVLGQPVGEIMQHAGSVLGAAWNNDESRILTWAADRTARLWDEDGILQQTLAHDGSVLGAAWNANGQRLLTWTRGNNVLIWDAQNGQQVAALPHGVSSFGVQGAVWNRDGNRILSWSSNGVARIWNIPADGRDMAATSTLLRNTMQHSRFVV